MLGMFRDLARVVTGRLSSAMVRKTAVIAATSGVMVGAAAVTAIRLASKEQQKAEAAEAAEEAAAQDTTAPSK